MALRSAVPEQIRAGSVAFHFRTDDGAWYGILLDGFPKVVHAGLIAQCYDNHSDLVFDTSENMVPANPAMVGGVESVPEAININLGLHELPAPTPRR